MKTKVFQLKLEGKKNIEIAKLLNLNPSTVSYHLMDDLKKKELNQKRVEKFRDLPIEEKRRIKYQKQNEYNKRYRKKRYNQDIEFKEKLKKYNRERQGLKGEHKQTIVYDEATVYDEAEIFKALKSTI